MVATQVVTMMATQVVTMVAITMNLMMVHQQRCVTMKQKNVTYSIKQLVKIVQLAKVVVNVLLAMEPKSLTVLVIRMSVLFVINMVTVACVKARVKQVGIDDNTILMVILKPYVKVTT